MFFPMKGELVAFTLFWGMCSVHICCLFVLLLCCCFCSPVVVFLASCIILICCSGLWSVIATGLFLFGQAATCNLHAAFEGLCYCHLRLPHLVTTVMHLQLFMLVAYFVELHGASWGADHRSSHHDWGGTGWIFHHLLHSLRYPYCTVYLAF